MGSGKARYATAGGSGRPDRNLASPDEVSEYLGVPVATLYQWRHRGIGPRAARVGRHVRYRWRDVERWVDDQSQGPEAA